MREREGGQPGTCYLPFPSDTHTRKESWSAALEVIPLGRGTGNPRSAAPHEKGKVRGRATEGIPTWTGGWFLASLVVLHVSGHQ